MTGSGETGARPEGPEPAGTGREPDHGEPNFLSDPKRVVQTLVVVTILVAAIYVFVPKLAGIEGAVSKLGDGDWRWIALAVLFNVFAFASYVALLRGVVGEKVLHLEWRESYQITMAGLAASRIFSAGGAGGIALTYWALRRAGMARAMAARRMVAFNVLLYAVYVIAVILFGVLLRTGVLPGPAPLSMTVVPAVIAGGVGVFFLLMALVPGDLHVRLSGLREGGRVQRLTHAAAKVPATVALGTRIAFDFVAHPSRGSVAILGAMGFWAANIAILWASFMAFDVAVPAGVIVQGFFVGMVANLAPAPAGVGAVDGGMIGAFVIFGFPFETVLAAILVYRLIAFWLPVPPGVIAFFQLRRTVARWEEEGRREPSPEPDPQFAGRTATS